MTSPNDQNSFASPPATGQMARVAVFPQTQWSMVTRAQSSNEEIAHEALSELCQRYWKPLYVFIRGKGYDPDTAKDLTQGFFEKLLRIESIRNINRETGSLRSYLLASMRYFLASSAEKRNAARRGAGREMTMDFETVENCFLLDSQMNTDTPEKLFEQRWAISLLDQVLEKLQEAFRAKGEEAIYDELNEYLSWNSGGKTYSRAAAALGMTEGAVKVRVYRMRRQFRDLLRSEIAQTVATTEEVDLEIAHLFGVFA